MAKSAESCHTKLYFSNSLFCYLLLLLLLYSMWESYLSNPKRVYEQLAGEPLQAFAWRVHSAMIETTGRQDIPDQVLFNRVLLGLHPRVSKYLPDPKPTTLHQFFCFGEVMEEFIPKDDSFWTLAGAQQFKSPTLVISIENEYSGFLPNNTKECFKCGITGHFAFQCDNQRNPKLRVKRRNRRKKNSGGGSCLGRGHIRCISYSKGHGTKL